MREHSPTPSLLLRRILSAGAFACALALAAFSAPAPAQTNPIPAPPDYDSPQLCETLGGTLLPIGDANICQNLDATGTFCIVASDDAFPCRGLFKHVIRCNDDYNRPALNPFICGPVCANGEPRGGTCALPFAEAALKPGQPFTLTKNSAARTGTYHGERRGLHYVYFTESNIFRQNPNRLATFADHAAQCALGNPEGQTTPWRPPTLAETAVLLADPATQTVPVSDAAASQTAFPLPLPPNTCAGQCAPPLANRSAAAANAVLSADLLRPEILTPTPTPTQPLAFTRDPHQTFSPTLVFPCVAPVAAGYASPPLDSRVKLTPVPSAVLAQTVVLPSYAAPNAQNIPAGTPLFTVSAVAQRWTIIAENNSPTLAPHPVPVTLRARVAQTSQTRDAIAAVVIPVLAPALIPAAATVLIPVSLSAAPEVGPVQTETFHYANIPVQNPPIVSVIVNATVASAEIAPLAQLSGGTLALPSPLPSGVQYEPNLQNQILTRRGPIPTQPEIAQFRFTHPQMRGEILYQFVFRPALLKSENPFEFIPAADLKRGGFRVFQTENIPLFTLTSAVPETRLRYLQPLNGDPLNYQGFAHRIADQNGEKLEFSAVPLSVATQLSVAPATIFYVARSPADSNAGWYPAFPAEGEFGSASVFTYSRNPFVVVNVNNNPQCSQVPGATRLLPDPSDPTNLDPKDVYICPIALCRKVWGGRPEDCRDQPTPARVIFGDFFPKKIRESDSTIVSDLSNLAGQHIDNIGLQPNPPDFAPTPSEIVLIDLHPLHRARCLPVADAKTQNLIPSSHPADDAVLFCPPPVRTATVLIAVQNPQYENQHIQTQIQNSIGILIPQTIRAAAILTLEITAAVRTEGVAFNPDQYFPPDNTANFLRPNPDSPRYHPALVVPNFASQITAETNSQTSETLIRHPVMIVRVPPNIRHNIAIPPESGFAITIVPRTRTNPGNITETGDPFEGEGRAHPHFPAEIRYPSAEPPDPANERLAVFYVPPNQPIPPQTSRAAVVRFTVIHADPNSKTETIIGAAQLTLSLTAVAQMPIRDVGNRYSSGGSIPATDMIPPEMLGMQNVFPQLTDENLMKDGKMTYLGSYRPALQPGFGQNPHAFTLVARNDRTVAYQLRINTTIENSNNADYDELAATYPAISGDHILSLKYANPNVFLGEYHMTFRANIPPMDAVGDFWQHPLSVEEFARLALSYDAAFYATVALFPGFLAVDSDPVRDLLQWRNEFVHLLRQIDSALDSYLLNPEITVLLGRDVPPNDYGEALMQMALLLGEQIFVNDGGAILSAPYLPYSLARYGRYENAASDHDSNIDSLAQILKYHASEPRIIKAHVAEGFAGHLSTYDPKESHQFQSADVRSRIPPSAPNRFVDPQTGLAAMRVPLPNRGGDLKITETTDGRMQISAPQPLNRPTTTKPSIDYDNLTGQAKLADNYLLTVNYNLSGLFRTALQNYLLGDDDYWRTSGLSKRNDDEISWFVRTWLTYARDDVRHIVTFTFSDESELCVQAAKTTQAALHCLYSEIPRELRLHPERIALTTQITIQEIRAHSTVNAILHLDLAVENGENLPPMEIPQEDATAGKTFKILLPDPGRFPSGGKWSVSVVSTLTAPTLTPDGRVSLTSALPAGLYVMGLLFTPNNAPNLLGKIPYRLALNVISLKTEAQAATDLANAAAAGNRDRVSRLLRESPVPATAKADSGAYAGKTPLHAALMGFASSDSAAQSEARINIVWELVENGANYWTTDNEGLAPMHRAMHSAANNATTLPIRALATAPFPAQDKRQEERIGTQGSTDSPIDGAPGPSTARNTTIQVDFAFAPGPGAAPMADGFTTPLQYASTEYNKGINVPGWSAAIREFVQIYGGEQGCVDLGLGFAGCITQRVAEQRRNQSGETKLHIAVRTQSTTAVEQLLIDGANVNAGLISDADIGNSPSPMHYAVSLADPNLVSLLALGFSRDKNDSGECPTGITPVVLAVGFSACYVPTNYQPGASWILDETNYPSVAITPPIYATILLAQAKSSTSPDAERITMLQEISEMLPPDDAAEPPAPDPLEILAAGLTGPAMEANEKLVSVITHESNDAIVEGLEHARRAFLRYLDGDDDYYAEITLNIPSETRTNVARQALRGFENGIYCAANYDAATETFYACMFNRIPRPGDPPVVIEPVTATITPAQLTGAAKVVYNEMASFKNTHSANLQRLRIMRAVIAGFAAYLNNDPDYYDGIEAVGEELNVDLTSLSEIWRNALAFRFEPSFPSESVVCFQSVWVHEEYFDCLFNLVDPLSGEYLEIPPETITPAQLTGAAKVVYDKFQDEVTDDPNLTFRLVFRFVRDAFAAYLNSDPDYYEIITAAEAELNEDFSAKVASGTDWRINIANQFLGSFPGQAFPCYTSTRVDKEFFDCLFTLVDPLQGEYLEIPPEIPGPVRLTRPVAANWSDESFTVYWRPPADDGGEITGYRIYRSQGNNKNNNRRPLDCDLPSFNYDRSFETYAFTVTVGQAGLYEYTMRPRGPSKTLGVTHGLCMRWHIAAVNSAGVGATVVTDPILSRGYVKSGQAYGVDDSRDGTSCPAGQYYPYTFIDNSEWNSACTPAAHIGRAEECYLRARLQGEISSVAYQSATAVCDINFQFNLWNSTYCADFGYINRGFSGGQGHCEIPARCGVLSEYNVDHRECQCEGWSEPASSNEDANSPTVCECNVLGADASNCECPPGESYSPETHSCQ